MEVKQRWCNRENLDPRRTARESKILFCTVRSWLGCTKYLILSPFVVLFTEQIDELRKQLGEPSSVAIQGFLSDASILRFLRARNWNVQKASKMLKAAVKWRASYKPEAISWVCLV
jgi:hypothetical protein